MATTPIGEQTVLEALRQVPRERWGEVLAYLDSLGKEASIGAADVAALAATTWTAAALRSWPRPLQDAILREQAARLIAQHREDPNGQRGLTWWTAREVAHLPVEQRDLILEASATVAAEEYRSNPALTAFEAFGEDDLYVDSANTDSLARKPPPTDAR